MFKKLKSVRNIKSGFFPKKLYDRDDIQTVN